MITNPDLLEAFEKELLRREKTDYRKNLRIYNALYQGALSLGVFPLKNPLDGIEVDIQLAAALNVQKSP